MLNMGKKYIAYAGFRWAQKKIFIKYGISLKAGL
jgi:hypothetical protein